MNSFLRVRTVKRFVDSPPSRRSRACPLGVALVAVTVLLSGCAVVTSEPKFDAPIVWEGLETRAGPDESAPPVRLALLEDGTAELTNFPRGRTADPEESACFEAHSGAYSGIANWKVQSQYLISLTFEDSEVRVGTGSRFLTEDWSEVTLGTCDESAFWKLYWVCGDSGPSPSRDSPYPTMFREPCSEEQLQ